MRREDFWVEHEVRDLDKKSKQYALKQFRKMGHYEDSQVKFAVDKNQFCITNKVKGILIIYTIEKNTVTRDVIYPKDLYSYGNVMDDDDLLGSLKVMENFNKNENKEI
jgi:hypothetical protein